ncbi:MAG: alpha-ketoacid dehydrogenase subunit beta [Gemmatimonadetes bacterium]|jgi:pyruvate dehydrogenase E1 component beta subunit|nr:alpha-ketoacid dehydrogenase subunit beta [Gemmatimonadota bacterium]MDE0961717.1 alpha-ketoacid dehydrogenase subunit beta [Candidatus Latescibacterota bacterium]MBT5325787.1 alpha-ketoacid dehydrogenase subunit beta [Gemmatimonadota bacterium]MBT5449030.1 alpha-ketoacid dehydrogenase subunit beta [Gemmatimonadota bacterium]MBT5804306.1 alpha-ketoacid dehydrogenase subunit beta [Gemmatimonadota bacterium]|tara:strand:- start:640 stop:1623 length:984 start_codon:yes stop_codon:yes gene_type:complete
MPDREMLFREAISLATAEEMRRDDTIFVMGEDVGASGGIFKCCEGLFDEFGSERVIDTPIAEAGYIGLGVGAAMTGMRPLAELMFGDFSLLTMDQIVNQAAKIRYMSGGQCKVPLTIRLSMGAGRSSAAQHSQSLHALFAHIPGLKVALPSTPRDAKGLLKTALRDDNPVLFFEDKMMYNDSGAVPEEDDFLIPFGEAEIKRPGDDLTIVATSSMVIAALEAAEQLAAQGLEAEVIDPRTLVPLDKETLLASVRKTGYALVVDEGVERYGASAELAAILNAEAFDYLDAPVLRIGAADVPIPFSPPLELRTIPNVEQIVETVLSQRR